MAFDFTLNSAHVLPDMLSHISVKPHLISHHFNSFLSLSPCQCNSDTKLNLCIIMLVTVFHWLWNLFTFCNSFVVSDFLLNATILFLFANIPGKYFHSVVLLYHYTEVFYAEAKGLLLSSLFFCSCVTHYDLIFYRIVQIIHWIAFP